MPSLTQDQLTRHAKRRIQQRRIRPRHLNLAITHGMSVHQNGACLYHLGDRHLPDNLPPTEAERAKGTTVVVSRDGHIITSYRRPRLRRRLRRRTHRRHVTLH